LGAVKYSLLEQVGIATGIVAIGGALGALSWFLAWLYLPDGTYDPGKLGALGAAMGTLCAISVVVWINLGRAWAIGVSVVLVAVVGAGAWRRVSVGYNRRHA
jgi:hypothetical protein